MATQYQNYKSDFVLREAFLDTTGKSVPLPTDVDFTLRYWTKHGHEYTASRQGGVYKNCAPEDGGTLLVFFKAHNLCEGELHHELHLSLDNPAFEGGTQNVFYPADLHILLWDKASSTDKLTSGLVADYTRGNAFKFDDFTDEQIEQLQKPAKEAANRYDTALRDYEGKASDQVQRIEKSATELEGLVEKFGNESTELVATMNSTTDEARKAVEAVEQRTAAVVKAAAAAAGDAMTNAEDARKAGQEARNAINTLEQVTTDGRSIAERAEAAATAATEAKKAADTATAAANKAKADADTAAAAARKAKQDADTATAAAIAAAQRAEAATQATEQQRAILEALIEKAQHVTAGVPTGMEVESPATVTMGNPVKQYVRGRVLPTSALQNVLYLSDGRAVDVLPDGEIVPKAAGTSRVHVIPTDGTRFYKTIQVEAVAPRIRIAGTAMRLDKHGNIRLT